MARPTAINGKIRVKRIADTELGWAGILPLDSDMSILDLAVVRLIGGSYSWPSFLIVMDNGDLDQRNINNINEYYSNLDDSGIDVG